MLPLVIGVVLGIALALFGWLSRFDQDKSFYPTVLIFIAGYYVLFAFMGQEAIIVEIAVALGFSALALAGYFLSPALIALGILLHGCFDFLHPHLINNAGVPIWWPEFCAGVDIFLGLWLLYLSKRQKSITATH